MISTPRFRELPKIFGTSPFKKIGIEQSVKKGSKGGPKRATTDPYTSLTTWKKTRPYSE